MKYKKVKLDEVVDLTMGFAFKSKEFNTIGEGSRLIRGKNVSTNFIRWGEDARYWNGNTKLLENLYMKKDDIVIGMDGSKVGYNRARITENDLPSLLVQRVARLRSKEKLNQKFLYYYIDNDLFTNYVNSVKTGTTIPHISGKQILNYEILLPQLNIQNAIVNIIEPIIGKIQINSELILKLKELAQTIFKSWFIDFEFPNEKGLPYKSSGGKMVDSEIGEIPDGWRVGRLEDYFELKYGKSLTKKNRLLGDYPVYGSGGITDYHKDYLIKGPGIILGRKGSIGTMYYEQDNFYPIDTVFYIESEEYSLNYIYFLLKTYDFTKSNNDSAVPGLNRNLVYTSTAIIPNSKFIQQFESIIEPMYEKIFSAEKEIKTLNSLRSYLLPKLLSGEIDIPDESVVD